MLTMMHMMELKEFAQEIGSYAVSKDDGRLTFQAFERDEFGPSAGIWGGFQHEDDVEGDAVFCVIYVMNSSGSTIATYKYFAERSRFVENGKLPALPEDDEEAAPLELAA